MTKVLLYETADGHAPFADWFAQQDRPAVARVSRAITRLEGGNVSNVKGVGEGVLEIRINFGPGYRVYFGRDGETFVILLSGGTKARQQRDIETARKYWQDYKRSMRVRIERSG